MVSLYGPVRTVREFVAPPGLALDAVQLRPEWCRGILDIAPEDHVDGIEDWADVDRDVSLELLQRGTSMRRAGGMPESRHTTERFAHLDVLIEWIRGRCVGERSDPAARVARTALRSLRADRTRGRVGDTAAQLGVSAKHLRRVVTAVAGDRPKTLQRLDRLNRAVAAADTTGSPRWSELATRTGYFDQAHLIRDFRALTQATPLQVHAERRAQRVPFFQSDRHRQG